MRQLVSRSDKYPAARFPAKISLEKFIHHSIDALYRSYCSLMCTGRRRRRWWRRRRAVLVAGGGGSGFGGGGLSAPPCRLPSDRDLSRRGVGSRRTAAAGVGSVSSRRFAAVAASVPILWPAVDASVIIRAVGGRRRRDPVGVDADGGVVSDAKWRLRCAPVSQRRPTIQRAATQSMVWREMDGEVT